MAGISLNDIQGAVFIPLPEGPYQIEVVGATYTPATGSKKPVFRLELAVTAGPNKGKKTNDFYHLTPASETSKGNLGIFASRMGQLGQGDYIKEQAAAGADLEDIAPELCQRLIGTQRSVVLKIEAYNEQFNNKIVKYAPLDGGVPSAPVVAQTTGVPSGVPVASGVPSASPLLPAGL